MEYVEGDTLRTKLSGGSLPVGEALSMTSGILEALTHAHAVGILHRDIKPENVMLTGDGASKLLDFGLAKTFAREGDLGAGAEDKTETALTEVGTMVGTIGYMSPEQLRGDPLDARSDLFAVGAILYESVSGERAFPGRTAGERITAILSRDPPPVSRPGTPLELQAILTKALARDVSRRYPSAAAFLSDLRRAGSGEFVSTLPDTIAILDFQNVSGNPDDEWIGSGIAESLATDLARASGLSVLFARAGAEGARRLPARSGRAGGGPGRGRSRPRLPLASFGRLPAGGLGPAGDVATDRGRDRPRRFDGEDGREAR